jgi:2-polyprenyl-6-methoxyphenol hydroxylase-like FAD-dependent oxidoreductase
MSDITVVGAGITGPTAALRLALMGYNVTVYEQRPATALFSAGILGITRENWNHLRAFNVPVGRYELPNGFTDYDTGITTRSPFRYITWTDLHTALMYTAESLGVRFVYEHAVKAPDTLSALTVDATGIAGAARRKLRSYYSGFVIYRGLSQLDTPHDFSVVRNMPGSYFNVGQTRNGASWAFFVPRPQPASLKTVTVYDPPAEYRELPAEFRDIVAGTPEMIVSVLSDWEVPFTMHTPDYRHFHVGDVNGPVRPVTTSGANLAIIEGLTVQHLIGADAHTVTEYELATLSRRAYDIRLGQALEIPEIGGAATDVSYAQHHRALFPGDPQ